MLIPTSKALLRTEQCSAGMGQAVPGYQGAMIRTNVDPEIDLSGVDTRSSTSPR